jgi:RHS repeat-associated protein
VVERRYYSEGEYLPLGGTSLYYSQDQLGSVRDVLAMQTGTRVASFDYDPYGDPSQGHERILTDFRYAGLFYDQQDGVYLASYRAYDPRSARWLSRDPIGETGGLNLYAYLTGNPSNHTDLLGYSWYSWLIDHAIDSLPESTVDQIAEGQQYLNFYQGIVEGFDPTGLTEWLYSKEGLGNNRCGLAYTIGSFLSLWDLPKDVLSLPKQISKFSLLSVGKNGLIYGGRRGAWSRWDIAAEWWDLKNTLLSPSEIAEKLENKCECQQQH